MSALTIGGYRIDYPKVPDIAAWTCHRHDHEFGPRLAGEFLGQAGDDQYRETRDQKRMFHALKDVKAPVFAR